MTENRDWREDAVCARVDGDFWYPEVGGTNRRAKAMCRSCPVMDTCLQWAFDHNEQWGVFGGMSADERRRVVRLAKQEESTAA